MAATISIGDDKDMDEPPWACLLSVTVLRPLRGGVKGGSACEGCADTLRPYGFEFSIVSRRAAYVSNPPGGVENRRLSIFSARTSTSARASLRSQESVRINRQLRSPISFRGYLAPLSRRLDQPENRFSSVSRPLLNVSGAASPRQLTPRTRISPNNNDRPAQARTT